MRLSLICHAPTRALRRAAFPTDEPIEDVDPAKAAALAALLPSADQIWTSTALRAMQTAAVLKLDAIPATALDDCDYGSWAGHRLADLQRDEPAAIGSWLQDIHATPHGGESLYKLCTRMATWMDRLDASANHVIAITHPATIRAGILHALGASTASFWRMDVNPLTLTDLRLRGGRWTVRSVGI